MSLINEVQELDYEEVLGMDSTSSGASIPRGYVRDAWNANPGLHGGYEKRSGYESQLVTDWGSRSITAGIAYRTPAGVVREVLFGTDGTTGTIGFVSAGAVTSILGSLSGTARGFFSQIRDLLGFFNGVDAPVIYNGTTTRQMGITRPANAPVFVSDSTAGELVQLASYTWAYTFYNSATGAESSPSDLFTHVLTGTDDEVTFTVDAGDATTADTVRVYRTYANGNQLFFEQEQTIGTTSISSTLSDASLTFAMELDNSRITDFAGSTQAQFPTQTETRIFLKTNRNEVRHSKVGQTGPMFESFEVSAVASTLGTHGNGDDVVGNGHVGEVPIILKERSVGRLEALGVQDTTLSVDKVRYQYKEMSDTIGAVAHGAQCNVYSEMLWLARDNIYATDGQRIRDVATPITSFLRNCGYLDNQRVRLSAVNDSKNHRVIFSVFVSGNAAHPVYQVVGDYRKYPTFRWTVYRPGKNVVNAPGLPVGCFYKVGSPDDDQTAVRFGNCKLTGKLYQMNAGDNDDGSDIHWRVKTRPYAMGQPLNEKLFTDVMFHVRGNGNDYDLTVSSIYDLAEAQEVPENFPLVATGDVWDTGMWDTSSWATDLVLPFEYQPHRKARFMQLVWEQAEADAPVELIGWGMLGSLFR